MAEYIENGARLGWLLDPLEGKVYVYRRDGTVECLVRPKTLSGEDVLQGLELNLEDIL